MPSTQDPEPIINAIQLLLMMLAAGILGGAINYFVAAKESFSIILEDNNSDSTKKEKKLFKFPNWRILIVNVVIGIGAAVLIPLFLATISSNLMSNLLVNADNSGSIVDAFVFFGFCLLAAISSRAFIQSLSNKILQEVKEAKKDAAEAKGDAAEAKAEVTEIQNEVTPIIEQATEAEELSADEQNVSTLIKTKQLSEDEKAILKALNNSRYTLRTKTGISKETGLDQNKVSSLFEELVTKGFVVKVPREKGVRWSITPRGRGLIEDDKNLSED